MCEKGVRCVRKGLGVCRRDYVCEEGVMCLRNVGYMRQGLCA